VTDLVVCQGGIPACAPFENLRERKSPVAEALEATSGSEWLVVASVAEDAEALEVPKPPKGVKVMKKGYMYILKCADDSYYTGSTSNLELRLMQHKSGKGANHTKKRLPIELVYYEEYSGIEEAFFREKQVQGWCRAKKEALIKGTPELLPKLALAYREKQGIAQRSLREPQGAREPQ
jgi:putative endonuclease